MEPSRRRYLIDIPGGEEEEPILVRTPHVDVRHPPYLQPPSYLKHIVPFGEGASSAESLYERLERANKVAWLVRFTYQKAGFISRRESDLCFAVAVEDREDTYGFGSWKPSEKEFYTFEVLRTTPAAKRREETIGEIRNFVRALERSEQEAREEAVRSARDDRAPLTPEDEEWLINQGYTPYTAEDGLIYWRHPDTGGVMMVPHAAIMRSPRPRRPRRASRRPVRTGLRIHPVPTGYQGRKKKVAFSVPEMANFAYGGLARGGRDFIQRGRNDRLERIPDNEGRGMSETPGTIEVHYLLFRNLIAALRVEANPDPTQLIFAELELYDAGWKTVTTKNRLQTLLDTADIPLFIVQSAWEWYLVPRETGWSTSRENWEEWEGGKTFAITLG